MVILLFGTVTVAVSLMHWEYVYNLMIFADSLVESLFPALVFGIYCKWATEKRYHLDFGRCDHHLPDLLRLGSRLCVVRHDRSGDRVRADVCGLQADKDDPKDSEDFYEALDSGHRRFMRIKAKIK